MTSSKLFFRLTFFFSTLLLTYSPAESSNWISNGDSVKPLPKINKHFLIVAHIALNINEEPNISEGSISSTVASINAAFQPIGVSFSVCEFRTIPNYNYDLIGCGPTDNANEVMVKHHVANRINIFYVSEITNPANACGVGSLGGISNTGTPFIIMKKGICHNAGVLMHEMGHYFGLPHTFEGSGSEFADGSNCDTDGDKICDTPADPYIDPQDTKDYVDGNCLFINQRKDAHGDYYDPDVSNPMSYYPCDCGGFTDGQFRTMVKYYYANPHKW